MGDSEHTEMASWSSRASKAIRGALIVALTQLGALPAAAGPSVGEAAPAFTLAGTDGKNHTLEDLLGEHDGVVLAWFPKAFTPG